RVRIAGHAQLPVVLREAIRSDEERALRSARIGGIDVDALVARRAMPEADEVVGYEDVERVALCDVAVGVALRRRHLHPQTAAEAVEQDALDLRPAGHAQPPHAAVVARVL